MDTQIIKTGGYKGPEGPYRGKWASLPVFIIRTPGGYGIVTQGEQPRTATPCASLRDARSWLRDNGYSL